MTKKKQMVNQSLYRRLRRKGMSKDRAAQVAIHANTKRARRTRT